MPKLPIFREPSLLVQALTHRSYINEHPEAGEDNERLELLGDGVLGFLVIALLYRRYPTMPEGQLSRQRAALVNEKQLAKLATELGIGELMRLGIGVEREGGRRSPSLLSNTFEAIIGAYFLDSGIEAVREFVEELFTLVADSMVFQSGVDSKSLLQQWVLANVSRQNPSYCIVAEAGPDHAKEYTAEVFVDNKVYGKGTGRSKQEAEKLAALDALLRLRLI